MGRTTLLYKQELPNIPISTTCLIMPRLVLSMCVMLSLVLLLPSSTTAAKGGAFLKDLCEKCEYCDTDPTCSGCSECLKCETRKQEGCRFCRKNEAEEDCKARCTKGCRICGGKNGDGLDSCKNRK